MESSLYVALSSQNALRRQMDVVANNIANMNTTAFKGENMMFVDHLVRSRGGERALGGTVSYVRDLASFRDIREGHLEPTGNTLDVAISGDGYFAVQTPAGERYTRNGRFQRDSNGQIVTQEGFPVLGDGGPITIPQSDTKIDIARDGTVVTETGQLGKFRVVRFQSDQQMQQIGGSLYATTQTPEDVQGRRVAQGMLESSNVQPIVELTRMIELQRTYEGVKNFVEKEDERIKNVIRELVRV
ncbi:MAG: flagellar basal-body rod protein FlgF [Rhodospirillales bacterium]|nr:flagellar basal-body rod protein FlgF [Rhodospirillales bacterium]